MIHSASISRELLESEQNIILFCIGAEWYIIFRVNLGKILYSAQILIVSKSMQNVSFCQMQNWGRIYKSPEILIMFCTSAEFYGLAIHSALILHAAE